MQELLAARRIDGAGRYFTRTLDSGYSKSSEETNQFRDRNVALSDIVWIIHTFKPDVVITRFIPTLGGHGNHTASAILAAEAFEAASDPSKFPEQLRHTTVWRPKRLVWNVFRFQQTDAPPPTDAVKLDGGEYSAWLGTSFTEIASITSLGSNIQITSTFLNRSDALICPKTILLPLGQKDTTFDVGLSYNRPFVSSLKCTNGPSHSMCR